jgi:hypothetical protein
MKPSSKLVETTVLNVAASNIHECNINILIYGYIYQYILLFTRLNACHCTGVYRVVKSQFTAS